MSSGVYVRTQKMRENISSSLRGRKLSRETLDKISCKLTGRKMSTLACKHKSEALLGHKVSEKTCEKIAQKLRGNKNARGGKGRKSSKETRELIARALTGKKHSESHNRKVARANTGKKRSIEFCEKLSVAHKGVGTGRKDSVETRKRKKEAANRVEVKQKRRKTVLCNIEKDQHNWNNVAPFGLENQPLERAFDLFFLVIFEADVRHIFKNLISWEEQHSKMFQLDFVSWVLKCNLEADELYHEKLECSNWDKQRDRAFCDTKELLSVLRYKQLEAETSFVDIVRRVYTLCNELRVEYDLLHLPILTYDERWNSYCEKMQEFLKEFRISRDYKKFDESKRELDKQYLWLLEEICKSLQTNFVELVKESLETNQIIDQDRIVSSWRMLRENERKAA